MSLDLEQYRDDPGDGGGRSGPGRTVRILGIAAFIGALFLLAYGGVQWLADTVGDAIASDDTVVEPGLAVTLTIAPGESASQIARDLAAAGVVASAAEFDRVVRESRASNRLQAGTYALETGMSPEAVLALLLEGPPRAETYRITVIEGLTIGQMLESIARQTDFAFDEMAALLLDGTVGSDLLPEEADELRDWEGLLFPDTYEFSEDATAAEVLDRLATTTEERVGAIDWSMLDERGLTPYEGVIVASLIEKEVVLDEERAVVASVVFNRLDLGMRLQIDATVIYALGAVPEGGLTLADLEVDSPYNTYLIDGLPPTPISGVRSASLRAAAAPADTEYLFYVVTDEETGRHTFVETFEEFLEILEGLGNGS